ncbi:MAG: hypothetical protein WCO71_09110, partial [Pseudomonadota bacterium]
MSSIQLPTYLLPLAALRKGVSGLWFLGAYCLGQPSADAQSATPAPPPHCSLGIDFVEIAGVTSKFAKHETRVSDFEIFLQETGYD